MKLNPKKRRKSRRSSRRSHRRKGIFRNPAGAVKSLVSTVTAGPREMVKSEVLVEALAVGVGFIGPSQVLLRLPPSIIDERWKAYVAKTGLIVLGAWGAGKAFGPKARRGVLIGGVVGLGIDLWVDFVGPWIMRMRAGALPAPGGAAGVGQYLEDRRGVGHYFEPKGMGGLGEEVNDAAEALLED